MGRAIRWVVPTVVAGLVGLFAGSVMGADAPTTAPSAPATTQPTGSIVVNVVDGDNNPVDEAMVGLLPPKPHANAAPQQAENGPPPEGGAPGGPGGGPGGPGGAPGGGGRRGPAPLASGTTDDKGSYTFTNIALGDYMVVARKKGEGRGRMPVTLSADPKGGAATATVTITLKKRGGGGPPGGAPGNGNGGPPPATQG